MTSLEVAQNLAVASLIGLAIGIERERSGHASGPNPRFAGVRTFFLLGLIGGTVGWLSAIESAGIAIALLVGVSGLVVAAYTVAARRSASDVEGTTEVAAFSVLCLGILAGRGELGVAAGASAVILLALAKKGAIHRVVTQIGDPEFSATLQFAALALVVLPLLPEGPYGPYDSIRPRTLWKMVLLFSALSFVAYIARRIAGSAAHGYLLTGALGGLVSSTAVTFSFARASQRDPAFSHLFAAGTLAASVVLIPRILFVILAVNPALLWFAARALLPVLGIGLIALFVTSRVRDRKSIEAQPVSEVKNPLELGNAIRMAVAFQIVLLIVAYANATFGDRGVLASAALAGLTDLDALTLGMAELARDQASQRVAARALLVGVLANTVFKTSVAFALGSNHFRRWVAPGFLAIGAAAIGMFFLW